MTHEMQTLLYPYIVDESASHEYEIYKKLLLQYKKNKAYNDNLWLKFQRQQQEQQRSRGGKQNNKNRGGRYNNNKKRHHQQREPKGLIKIKSIPKKPSKIYPIGKHWLPLCTAATRTIAATATTTTTTPISKKYDSARSMINAIREYCPKSVVSLRTIISNLFCSVQNSSNLT